MTLPRILLACFVLSIATTGAFAVAPASAPPAAADKNKKTPAPPAPAAAIPAPSTNAPASTLPPAVTKLLDDYMKDLTEKLKLTDEEAKTIKGLYLADGKDLVAILNDDQLSPLKQSQQVADLRDVRNEKIAELLHDFQRQRDFLKVEAKYRVALMELAANGGLVADAAPAPAPPAAK